MKTALVMLLVLHGLIHLMGPAKAYGWADLPGLTLPMSRGAGAAWGLTALLLLAAAAMALLGPRFPDQEWWWAPALAGVVLSQVLIAGAWRDAKFGTIANVVLLVPVVVAAASSRPGGFRDEYRIEAAAHRARVSVGPDDVVSHVDLAALPPPVRRYLEFAGVIGRPRVRAFHVRFEGVMRAEAADAWMPTIADQHSTFGPHSRLFIMKARRSGVPFEALHIFSGPHATFRVKVASLVPVMEARGPEMDQSETVTMLNDMSLLAPATLIDARIAWSDVTDRTARAAFTHEGRTVSAVLTFGDTGALVNFESDDRYRSDGARHQRARWSTPIERWAVVDGVLVPVVAEARWRIGDAEFAYARFRIATIDYR